MLDPVESQVQYFYICSDPEDEDEEEEEEGTERLWLCDTACPFDLISRETLPPDLEQFAEQADEPAMLATANGIVEADKNHCYAGETVG